jgi:hypothetical protein
MNNRRVAEAYLSDILIVADDQAADHLDALAKQLEGEGVEVRDVRPDVGVIEGTCDTGIVSKSTPTPASATCGRCFTTSLIIRLGTRRIVRIEIITQARRISAAPKVLAFTVLRVVDRCISTSTYGAALTTRSIP